MRTLACACFVGLVGLACGCAAKSTKPDTAGKIRCLDNLQAVALVLRTSIPTEPDYPLTLTDTSNTNASLFVCPSTGHKPGDMASVEEWSDYIYVGNLLDVAQDPKVALLICPPENHDGKYGYVVWLTREVAQLSAPDIRRLIMTPWCFATNAPADQIERLKKRVSVRIPRRLRAVFSNAYGSPKLNR